MNRRKAEIVSILLLFSLPTFAPLAAAGASGSAAALPSVSSIPVGSFPISLGFNPSNGHVYVGSFDGSISVISGTKVVGNILSNQVGYSALSFAYDQHDQAFFVAGGDGVSAISGNDSAAAVIPGAGTTSQAVMYDPSNGYIYVANLGWIAVLTGSGDQKGAIPVDLRPGGFVFDSFDNYTYVDYMIQSGTGAETGAELYAFYGTGLAGNLTLTGGRGGLVPPTYDACHDYVYVANTSAGTVSVIWGDTIIGEVSVGQEPSALAYDAANHYVYVADYTAGTVAILSGPSLVGSVQVGASPVAVAYNPYDGDVYVANEDSGTVSVISGTAVIATVPVGRNPVAMVYDASNENIYVANNGDGSVSLITPQAAAASGNGMPCSPRPAGLVTTTTTTATTTVTATTTTTTSTTATTTSNNTVTTTVTKDSPGAPIVTTSSSPESATTTTTTLYPTSTSVTMNTTNTPSNASSTAGSAATTNGANAVVAAAEPSFSQSGPSQSNLLLLALVALPVVIVLVFLGGLIAGKRRAPRRMPPSEWDVPLREHES